METKQVSTRGDGIRWQVVLGLAVVDGIWMTASGRIVTRASLHATAGAILMLLAIAWLLAAVAGLRRVTATSRGLHYRRLALAAHGGAWLVVITAVLSVLSYLLTTLAFPLVCHARQSEARTSDRWRNLRGNLRARAGAPVRRSG